SLAQQGTTIVVVEQSLNVPAALAERAVFMERVEVRYTGPTAGLADQPELARSIFLRTALRGDADTRKAGVSRGETLPARLEIAGLRRRFGGVAALDGVDLVAAAGEIVGIIGANGAGKSTLFDVCSGFVVPDSGSVVLDGADVTAISTALRAELGLGRMFQDARLFPSLTDAETLAVALDRHVSVRDPLAGALGFGAALDSEEEVRSRVDELIATMGLERYRNAFVSELSTGTRRIVELAGALAHQPRVLLLDEPSSGIAQRESEALGELLLRIRDRTGATLVVIEHDIPLVSSVADRLLCMHLGKVIAEGTPADVVANPAVIASYLGTDQVAIARSEGVVSGVPT
ncbi:MAG: ABC transporter ATP-binding protein, partial [Acidimicrobiales bacterium]